jgi:DNA polymerase-3 subunit delta'
MDNLLLHSSTRRQIDLIFKSPPHAILICGQPGTGKQTLAERISISLLDVPPNKLTSHPYFTIVQKPEGKQEIPIEAIREVIRQLKLKPVVAAGLIKRVVLVDEAHLLSTEAQNALLKAIEEPPPATVFILTAISETSVLPTIASRTQKIKIGTVSLMEAKDFFKGSYSEQTVTSAWQLSGGTAGLMTALLRDDSDHPLKKSVETAKKLLGLNRYERLLLLDELSAKKTELLQTFDALSRVLAALHHAALKSDKAQASSKLLAARKQIDSAMDSLSQNTSPRLVAMDIALNLPV